MKAGPDGRMPYTGVVDCAAKILRAEGPLAFWVSKGERSTEEGGPCGCSSQAGARRRLQTGFVAYYGRTAPHAMIILITLEQLNRAYKRTFDT